MEKQNTIFIVCNWKTYFLSTEDALKTIKKIKTPKKRIAVGIAPSALHLESIKKECKNKSFYIGSQYISENTGGANTGEIIKEQLANENIDFVIIGHTERRAMGDNINKQIKNTLSINVIPILCIGEKIKESTIPILKKQIREALKGLKISQCKKIIFAYEPVKFIGKKHPMPIKQINSTMETIKKILKDNYKITNPILLYGGSVNEKNSEIIINNGGCSGLLLGRASINSKVFNKVLKCISIK